MTSAKQLKNILTYSFSGGDSNFIAPTASFSSSPSSYADTDTISSLILSGTILPNNGRNIQWNIKDPSNTILESSTGNSVSHSVASIPSTVGSYSYSLNITYQDETGTTFPLTVLTTLAVSTAAKIGNLAAPGDTFSDATGFNNLAVESGFTIKSQVEAINLFSYALVTTAKLVIVVPDSYGTLTDIQDNTDSSVLSQFTAIIDSTNARKLYLTNNVLAPATYNYKLVY